MGLGDETIWLVFGYSVLFIYSFIYYLLSITGFHQKAQDLYKGASQVTKTDTVQLNKTKTTIQCSYLKNSLEIGLASFLGSFAGASYSF